jgi:hypothetical protein
MPELNHSQKRENYWTKVSVDTLVLIAKAAAMRKTGLDLFRLPAKRY